MRNACTCIPSPPNTTFSHFVIFLEHVSERKIIQDMLIDYNLMTDNSAIIKGVAKTLISRLQNKTSQCLR